jgi:hypothetical protein
LLVAIVSAYAAKRIGAGILARARTSDDLGDGSELRDAIEELNEAEPLPDSFKSLSIEEQSKILAERFLRAAANASEIRPKREDDP